MNCCPCSCVSRESADKISKGRGSVGCAMASLSESGASSEDVVEWVREASSRLHSLEVQSRHLNALCNTLQLRLDEVQSTLDRLQSQLKDERGITLPARVDALAQVLTQAVETCNRVEPEVRLLLQWRRRFTSSLQTQLCYLGHQFALICPRLDLEALD